MATEAGLGMKTTFGASAFRNASAKEDAFIVKKIREAGMIVLGKANLDVSLVTHFLHALTRIRNSMVSSYVLPSSRWHSLTLRRGDRLPTGWSTVGGQTVSPYDGEV